MNEDVMYIEECEHGFKGWWRRNKKIVIVVGGILTAAGCGYAVYKNWDIIKGLFVSTKPELIVINSQRVPVKVTAPAVDIFAENLETIRQNINGGEAFDVSTHIRNLPKGWKASPEKIAEAAELGINLLDNQTLVDSYMKNAA